MAIVVFRSSVSNAVQPMVANSLMLGCILLIVVPVPS
jgi:hypothetical protein